MENTRNRLLPCLDMFFTVVAELSQSEPTLLRPRIKQALSQFELSALEQLIDIDSINKTKYALVAFIDESAIRNPRAVGSNWVTNPLQLEYFGENTAGERFFTQLASLRLQADKYIDALEIYYLCLELGYEGQYRLNGKPLLLHLKNELLSQIQQIRQMDDVNLSPRITPITDSEMSVRDSPIHRWAIASLALVALVFTVFMTAISYQASQDRKSLLDLQDQLFVKHNHQSS